MLENHKRSCIYGLCTVQLYLIRNKKLRKLPQNTRKRRNLSFLLFSMLYATRYTSCYAADLHFVFINIGNNESFNEVATEEHLLFWQVHFYRSASSHQISLLKILKGCRRISRTDTTKQICSLLSLYLCYNNIQIRDTVKKTQILVLSALPLLVQSIYLKSCFCSHIT